MYEDPSGNNRPWMYTARIIILKFYVEDLINAFFQLLAL